MEAELGAEIGNQVSFGVEVFLDLGVYALLVVGIKGRQYALKVFHKDPVIGSFFQVLLGNASQECLGVMSGTAPKVLVEPGKQAPYLAVPAVKKVVCQITQPC